jgi:glutaconate CoA-transferase, subunit A
MEASLLCLASMARICSLKEAISAFVHDGDSVAAEGFSHLIPFAAGHEIIRQLRRDLTLIRLTPDLIYDQIIGAGCARKMVFSWAEFMTIAVARRFRNGTGTWSSISLKCPLSVGCCPTCNELG